MSGSGAVDHNQLVQLTEDCFGSLPPPPSQTLTLQPAIFTPSEIRIREDDIELVVTN
jgi:predicted Zn-dependent peptidase